MRQYNQRMRFQKAFNVPFSREFSVISSERLELSRKWINEEIIELKEAETDVDEVDALLDVMYFAVGLLVETGFKPQINRGVIYYASIGYPQFKSDQDIRREYRPLSQSEKRDTIQHLSLANENMDLMNYVRHAIFIYSKASLTLSEMGLNVENLFTIVHRANMKKLYNGKPKYKNNKIIKPKDWIAPEPMLEHEMIKSGFIPKDYKAV